MRKVRFYQASINGRVVGVKSFGQFEKWELKMAAFHEDAEPSDLEVKEGLMVVEPTTDSNEEILAREFPLAFVFDGGDRYEVRRPVSRFVVVAERNHPDGACVIGVVVRIFNNATKASEWAKSRNHDYVGSALFKEGSYRAVMVYKPMAMGEEVYVGWIERWF